MVEEEKEEEGNSQGTAGAGYQRRVTKCVRGSNSLGIPAHQTIIFLPSELFKSSGEVSVCFDDEQQGLASVRQTEAKRTRAGSIELNFTIEHRAVSASESDIDLVVGEAGRGAREGRREETETASRRRKRSVDWRTENAVDGRKRTVEDE